MESLRGTRRRYPFPRARRSTLYVLLLASAGHLNSLSWAQTNSSTCETARRTTPIRIENSIGVGTLRAEANCTNRGVLTAEWAAVPAVTIDTPIAIAPGTFLSVTGDDALAEVQGGSLTRLFEVSPGGSLTLTGLKLSGGSARNGGAIYSDRANLTLDGCVFDGNVATDGDGGAVWADGGSVTIVGGEFLNNNAILNGGAVLATDASLVVKGGARFENNEATAGGALYCSGLPQQQAAGLGLAITTTLGPSCSITDAEFVSNRVLARSRGTNADSLGDRDGGGAAAFLHANVSVTRSVFSGNSALLSGGGVFGGNGTDMKVLGCTFENNTSENGGAIAASSMTLGGDTRLRDNFASDYGGAVHGWDAGGTVAFTDVSCTQNLAEKNGGCFFTVGTCTASSGTVMHNNHAENGGCIYADSGSDVSVDGGDFMCQCNERGGFIFVGDNTRLKITGGLFANNLSGRRAGVVYCNGDGVSTVTIEGGTFRDNRALELGGAIVAWGLPTVVNITGGEFTNNTAKFYGGFIFLEEGASLLCQGANITGNYAGDQGGGIYAREATWVNSSCDLIASESPQGAAIYLTNVKRATFEDHKVADTLASSGSVVFVAASAVVARGVAFESGVGLQDDSLNRAIQLDGASTLNAEGCVFEGWLGDTVIYHTSPASGSLVLDSCDFSGSSAPMAVISPNSDAEIRNAVVGDRMLASAVASTLDNSSLTLVDRALDCSEANICGLGTCVDSLLGVLCECLAGGQCLNDGGELSLDVQTDPANVTYSPSTVSYLLLVSSKGDGTTNAIWKLQFEAGDLSLSVVPPSGVLLPGRNITVAVTGTPATQDVGGAMTSSFVLKSVGTAAGSLESAASLEVGSTFYLCKAYEYAVPVPDGGGVGEDNHDGIKCDHCANIKGEEGVDCESPGATKASLPVKEGYWRASRESTEVHECLYSDACKGATKVLSSNDYCHDGYRGPYCAVCSEGYGRGVSNSCHHCDDTKARFLISAGALFSLVLLLLLLLAVVFLVGGLDAIDSVREALSRKLSLSQGKTSASQRWRFTPEASLPLPQLGPRVDTTDTAIAPAYDFVVEDSARSAAAAAAAAGGGGGECSGSVSRRHWGTRTSHGRRVSPSNDSEPDNEARDGIIEDSDMPDDGVRGGVDHASDEIGHGLRAHPEASDVTPEGYAAWEAGVSGRGHARPSAVADAGIGTGVNASVGVGVGGAIVDRGVEEVEVAEGGKSKCCGFGDKVKRWLSRLPLDKLKILVVVWQILTVFSSITGVEFPASYSTFLSWINVVNLDIGNIFSASCLLPTANFYVRLLVTTLAPLVLAAGLLLTYYLAKGRAGIGRAGVIARRAAWSRHVAAWLLLTFLVFTSASTVVFKTFACDSKAVEGESYLRADYSISCTSNLYMFFEVYAGLMILVYPIGIPVLYASILWKNRELLNPRIDPGAKLGPDDGQGGGAGDARGDDDNLSAATHDTAPKGLTKHVYSPEELHELEQKVKARRENPELVPSMFLWKDFGPDLYYYEVVECGRRMLLTGVLIFISPQSPTQTAMACIFAFGSLLGFELMRPHLDPADAWLYRMGCVVIFLSNFLALLIKVDAAGEDNRAVFGALLVFVNVLLVLAVLVTSWFATQQSVDDSREEENTFTLAKTMLTAEQYAATSARLTRERNSARLNHERNSARLTPGRRRGVLPSSSFSVRPYMPVSGGSSAAGGLGVPPSRRLQRGGGASGVTVSEDVAPTYERAGGGLFVPPLRRPHRRVASSEGVGPTYGGGLFAQPSRGLQLGGAISEDAIPAYVSKAGGGLLAWPSRRGGASDVTATSGDVIANCERAAGGLGVSPSRGLRIGGAISEDAAPIYERAAGGLFATPSRGLQRGAVVSEDAIPTYERATGGFGATPSRGLQRSGARFMSTSFEDAKPIDERAAEGLFPPPSGALQRGGAVSEDVIPTYERTAGDILTPSSRRLQLGGAISEDVVPTYERAAGGLGATPSRKMQRKGASCVSTSVEDAKPIYERAAEGLFAPPSGALQRGGAVSEDVIPTHERTAGGILAPSSSRLQLGGAISEDGVPTYEHAAGGLGATPSRSLQRSGASLVSTSFEEVAPIYERAAEGLFAPPSRGLQRGGAIRVATSEDALLTYERRADGGLGATPSRGLQFGDASGATKSEDVLPRYERATGGFGVSPSRGLQRGDAKSEDVIPTFERVAGGLFDPPFGGLQRGGAVSEDAIPTYERTAGGILTPSYRRLQRGDAFGAKKSEDVLDELPAYDHEIGSVEAAAVDRLPQRSNTRGVYWHG